MGLQKAVIEKNDRSYNADENAKVRKNLDKVISEKSFPNIILLYGEEAFMRLKYKNELIRAFEIENEMNLTYFNGEITDVTDLIDVADTMPFFEEKRLIIADNSGLFSAGSNGSGKPQAERFAEYLDNLPDSTYIIFSEISADKRFKLFKKVESMGLSANLRYLSEEELLSFIGKRFRDADVGVSRQAAEALLDRVGLDMTLLNNEIEKLIAFHEEGKTISSKDVQLLGTVRAEDAIFDMIENAVSGNIKTAMDMYADLLALKEAPIKIMIIIGQQCSKMLATLDGVSERKSNDEIAKALSVKPGAVYYMQKTASKCGRDKLRRAVKMSAEMDELVKNGDMKDQLACELILISLMMK